MALQVIHKRVPCSKQEQSLLLTAVENTWIHSREKRREGSRQLRELPRAPHRAATSSATSSASSSATSSQTPLTTAAPATNPVFQNQSSKNSTTQGEGAQNKAGSAQEPERVENGSSLKETSQDVKLNPTAEQKDVLEDVSGEDMELSTCSETGQEAGPQEAPVPAQEPPSKRPKSPAAPEHFLFKCLLNVMMEECDVVIEMHWVEGQSRDLMNQLCTYLKNTLLRCIAKP